MTIMINFWSGSVDAVRMRFYSGSGFGREKGKG